MNLNHLMQHHIKTHFNIISQKWARCKDCWDEFFETKEKLAEHIFKEHTSIEVNCEISLKSLDEQTEVLNSQPEGSNVVYAPLENPIPTINCAAHLV